MKTLDRPAEDYLIYPTSTRLFKADIPEYTLGVDWKSLSFNRFTGEELRWYYEDVLTHVQDGVGLYLWSAHCAGKTTAASLILAEYIVHGGGMGVFLSCQEYFDGLKLGFGKPETEREADIAMKARLLKQTIMEDMPLVVLDDFGRERGSEWVSSELDLILRARHNRGLATVVTSNLSPDTFEQPGLTSIIKRSMYILEVVADRDYSDDVQSGLRGAR